TLDLGNQSLAIFEGAMSSWFLPVRPGKKLIPGAEERLFPIDCDGQFFWIIGRLAPVRRSRHQIGQVIAQCERNRVGGVLLITDRLAPHSQTFTDFGGGSPSRRLEVFDPDQQLDLDVLFSFHSLAQVFPPGLEVIYAGLQRVVIVPDLFDREASFPAVIAYGFHRRFAPGRLGALAIAKRGSDFVMAIREDVGLYDDPFTDDPFDGKSTAVNFRVDAFDNYSFFALRCHHFTTFPRFYVANVHTSPPRSVFICH